MELTVWGYIDGDTEVLDFQVHKETDKNRGINMMIKKSGYFLSRVIPYLIKNKDKKIRLDNISYEETVILFYLDLNKDFDILFLEEENGYKLDKRIWVEQQICRIPALVNTLWTLDYKGFTPKTESESIPLTQITSYSRPEILEFDSLVYNDFKPKQKRIAIIPCSSGKPYHNRKYDETKTFTKISGGNKHVIAKYLADESYDKVVLTSLGLIPQEFWLNDVVMKYDTGTRDLWKLLCLTKRFFEKNKYDKYDVLVKFKPYRDIIRNLIDMGTIDKDKCEFIGNDEKSNGLRIMFYPNEYKLYK